MPASSSSRLAYIDWMRGLACVLMFQTHCYDSWLGGSARQSKFFMWSQLGGTLPAPLFLFLAGISFALVTAKLRDKEVPAAQIARTTFRRGAEIFGLGLLFRLQEFLIAWPWAPWSDLFRVDILNTIGISMMMMAGLCWIVLRVARSRRSALVLASVAAGLIITLLTPFFWTTWRPDWLPWPIESYVNGVHNLGQPQPWLFPIFPWTGFAFMGLAVGFFLISGGRASSPVNLATRVIVLSISGLAVVFVARWLDHGPTHFCPVYDFWHTSPNFFLIRVGLLLLILGVAYAWCRWGLGHWGFSPLAQMGQTSLLVYWVHIEFVYGRLSILSKRSQSITSASCGLLTILMAMLLLSIIRTSLKGRGWQKLGSLRKAARA
ncbi:MAG: DUF1624 domain-containing protein [Acidobacteriaceae bacterium]|nr:DUF1624 domain-containing protein [Acidobacteriaceae bacterium]